MQPVNNLADRPRAEFAVNSYNYNFGGGSCGTWTYRHDESWGPTARHFIRTTADNAARWNDTPDDGEGG